MAPTGLAKATVTNTQTNLSIPVMYNPDELKLEQGNTYAEVGIPGRDSPPLQYVRGRSRTLTMDLFFDTYEQALDVRTYTSQLAGLLTTQPPTQAPPVLLFSLGQFNFECVLVDAGQRFTMFLRDGTPVRSTMSVRLQEYVRLDIQVSQGFFLPPPTLHDVVQGQTLSGLAAQYLGDPTRWRDIATANNIDDPLNLQPGQTLRIPQVAQP